MTAMLGSWRLSPYHSMWLDGSLAAAPLAIQAEPGLLVRIPIRGLPRRDEDIPHTGDNGGEDPEERVRRPVWRIVTALEFRQCRDAGPRPSQQ